MTQPGLHIEFFKIRIHTFHFFGVIGFILGTLLGIWLSQEMRLLTGVVLLLSLLGAGVFFGLVYLAKLITGSETIVYYHHEIGIVLFSVLALWILKLPILPYLDIVILGIATFLSFGRIGCYSVGCCHGRPHSGGVRYGREHVAAGFTWYYENVSLFPIQLVESISVMTAVVTGVILMLSGVLPGTIFIFYTITYGLFRYVFEFFRGDPDRPLLFGLSEAQWTSLSLAAITFLLSLPGWLPYYDWHLFALITMTLATVTTMCIYRLTFFSLFMPKHIKEIATGLRGLHEQVINNQLKGLQVVNIYKTKRGLRISCNMDGNIVSHCTVSLGNKTRLTNSSIRRIARILSQLNNSGDVGEIIQANDGIYHIMFETQLLKRKVVYEVA